ncbi:MAG TPA: fluoride efflux transporter CrcB [Planctomycetota bacterium]|jgi:CrcB protein
MRNVLLVMLGGAIGTLCRYGVSVAVPSWLGTTFPWGTAIVNLVGCLIIGLIFGLTERGTTHASERLFLVTGFCGGLTTFSSFAMETAKVMPDSMALAGANFLLNNVCGLALTFLGMWLGAKI